MLAMVLLSLLFQAPPVEEADWVDLVLEASGVLPVELPEARQVVEQWLETAVRSSPSTGTDAERAMTLLNRLHSPHGPLKTYDELATTLNDIRNHGRFNCVSSTALFLLGAKRAQLEAKAELLPTHARARVRIKGVWHIVETTLAHGFMGERKDASLSVEPRMMTLGSSSTEEATQERRGLLTDFRGIVSVMYTNRGTLAERRGELRKADAFLARGEAVVPTPSVKSMLRNQRASILARLAFSSFEKGGLDNYKKARRDVLRALRLEPSDTLLRELLKTNTRVLTELIVSELTRAGDFEAATTARQNGALCCDTKGRAHLRVLEHVERARYYIEQKNSSSSAARELKQALSAGEELGNTELIENARNNLAVIWKNQAYELAQKGRWKAALRKLSESSQLDGREMSETHDETIGKLCRIAGGYLIEQKKVDAAIEAFERGLQAEPENANAKQGLAWALQVKALDLIRAGKCSSAEPLLQKIHVVQENTRFVEDARMDCFLFNVDKNMKAEKYAEAVEWLEQARSSAPHNTRWKPALKQVLEIWAYKLIQQNRCQEAESVFRRSDILESPVSADIRAACP